MRCPICGGHLTQEGVINFEDGSSDIQFCCENGHGGWMTLRPDDCNAHYTIYVPLRRSLVERLSRLREVLSTLESCELTFSEAIEALLKDFGDEITAWIGVPI